MRRYEKTVESGRHAFEIIQPHRAYHERIAAAFSQYLHLFGKRICRIPEQTTYQKLFHVFDLLKTVHRIGLAVFKK